MIKHIQNGWYLYEKSYKYDAATKHSRKISGALIGTITPQGLIPTKHRKPKEESQETATDGQTAEGSSCPDESQPPGKITAQPAPGPVASRGPTVEQLKAAGMYTPNLSDIDAPSATVEVGAVAFLYQLTGGVRDLLCKYFPTCWALLYTLAMIRAIFMEGGRLSYAELMYHQTLLSHLYPFVDLSKNGLTVLMRWLGLQRGRITSFMKELSSNLRGYLLIDGTRVISYSKMVEAQKGYDSRMRHERQINLMYLVGVGSWGKGVPGYYKQYCGSIPDVGAINDLLAEVDGVFKDVVIIGDKGTKNNEACDQIIETGLNYVFGVKRGNNESKGEFLDTIEHFGPRFTYNGRSIAFHAMIWVAKGST